MDTKICRKCGQEKQLAAFGKKLDNMHGQSICKQCDASRAAAARAANIEKYREINRKSAIKCIDRVKKAQAVYRKANREALIIYCREYRKTNKVALAQKDKIRKAKRRDDDYEYRILCSLRARTNAALHGINKSDSTLELLGCTIEFFREYLESRFTDGMSWSNYGRYGWHLDHVRPCSSFDLYSIEQQKQCFHYTNFQPLWAEDNLRKSDTWEAPCNSVTPMV